MPRNYFSHFSANFYAPLPPKPSADNSSDEENDVPSYGLLILVKRIIRGLIEEIIQKEIQKLGQSYEPQLDTDIALDDYILLDIDKADLAIILYNQAAKPYGLPPKNLSDDPDSPLDPRFYPLHFYHIPFSEVVATTLSPALFNKQLLNQFFSLFTPLYNEIKTNSFPTEATLSDEVFATQREVIEQCLNKWNAVFGALCQLELQHFVRLDESTQAVSLIPADDALLQLPPLIAQGCRKLYLTENSLPCYTLMLDEKTRFYNDNGIKWAESEGKVISHKQLDFSQAEGLTIEDTYFWYASKLAEHMELVDLSHVIPPPQGSPQDFLFFCLKNAFFSVFKHYLNAGMLTSPLLSTPVPSAGVSLFRILISQLETNLIHLLLDKNLINASMLSEQPSKHPRPILMVLLEKKQFRLLQRFIEENLIHNGHLTPHPQVAGKTFLEGLVEENQIQLIRLLATKNLLSPTQLPQRAALKENQVRRLLQTEQAETLMLFVKQNLIQTGHLNWDGFLYELIQFMPTKVILLFIEQDLVTKRHVDFTYTPDSYSELLPESDAPPANIPYMLAEKNLDEVFKALLEKRLITHIQLDTEFFSFHSYVLKRRNFLFHTEEGEAYKPRALSTRMLLEKDKKKTLLDLIDSTLGPRAAQAAPTTSTSRYVYLLNPGR